MVNSTEHLEKRFDRYYINSQTESFKEHLKGLAVVELCITELCTRTCKFCPRGDATVYKNRNLHMSIETVGNFARKCKEEKYTGDIHISGFGEPFLHKKIFDIVKTLKMHLPNNRVTITNNGDCLNKMNLKEIYECGLDFMIISCYDGPESKEKFDLLFQESNIPQSSYEIRKLWSNPNEDIKTFVEKNKFNNRSGAVSSIREEKTYSGQCYLPFYKLVIDWNGDALLCCNDWLRRHKGFGNVNEQSLREIWFGEEFTKVRKSLATGDRANNPACKHCNITGTLIGKESVDILL